MRIKNLFHGVLCIIFGICLIIFGAFTLLNPDQVTCGGEKREAGDTYVSSSKNSSVTCDYDEQKSKNQTQRFFALGGGIFLTIYNP